jgi:hypothetical protein
MTTIKVSKKDIADLLRASFPEYTGRKFRVQITDRVWVDRIGGGGSREEIVALAHVDGKWIAKMPEVSAWNAPCGELPLSPMAIYAVHAMFCGHDAGITFNVHPKSEYLPKGLIEK